ncbi:MAG: DUF2877 domain-containing protein [Ruminococcaceae bacterium]|nr:DUF2877 domain-containing protein [Oscillospiraceae bacterium]
MATLKLSAGKIARRIAEKGEIGTVIGVFSQGIYCKVRAEIILFHCKKWGYVPFGLGLESFSAFSEEVSANVGDTVVLTENSLAMSGKTFDVELSCEAPTPFAPSGDADKERLDEIFKYVSEHGSAAGILDLIEKNRIGCRDAIRDLANGDIGAASKLIGLGRGLTPSGDDFLCGYFAVLNARGVLAVSLRESIYDSLDRTTQISAAYISAVLGRRYFSIYDSAVKAIFSDGDFKKDVDFVLSMGASSGTDTMVGALVAARYNLF